MNPNCLSYLKSIHQTVLFNQEAQLVSLPQTYLLISNIFWHLYPHQASIFIDVIINSHCQYHYYVECQAL